MAWTRRGIGIAGAGLALTGCATAGAVRPAPSPPLLAPLRLSPHRLTKITVCLRPFRPAGPRIEVETVGDKRIVHNYGHGGAGWSLAWGSSAEAARLALQTSTASVAVLGAGALGLTAATLLRQSGVAVKIYARDLPPETRSARATGTWSPDSRIALSNAMPAGFPAAWEAMTRASYAMHQAYVGLAGEPVEWTERYSLADLVPQPPYETQGFAHLGGRVRGLTPPFEPLAPGAHPFPTVRARRGITMTFNVAEYAHRLLSDLLIAGAVIRRATFHSPADLAALPEPVIVNCTGYGARELFQDASLVPVRGQIGWLPAQPEARYGVYYRHTNVLARRDGIAVQYGGQTDSHGYGVADETPDQAEFDAALALTAPLFRGWQRA